MYYIWNSSSVIVLLFISLIVYFFSLKINSSNIHSRKYLCAGILLVSSVYVYFKVYAEVFNNFLFSRGTFQDMSILADAIPLGISFYTFQAISYLVDVYKKIVPPERNPLYSILYLTFFPQLTAGPIERASHLLPQLRKIVHNNFNEKMFYSGLQLIALGLFKKFVLADNLRSFDNMVSSDPEYFYGLPFVIAVFVARYSTFLDLFAYIDIAQGSARLFGINLVDNFKQPFLAKSPTDFWKRFHISLVSWFWSYVYLPLCRMFPGIWTVRFIAVIMFILVGIWHKLEFSFFVWGFLHGVIFFIASFIAGRPSWILKKIFRDKLKLFQNFFIILGTQVILSIPLMIAKLILFSDKISISKFIILSWNNFCNLSVFTRLLVYKVYMPWENLVVIIFVIVFLERAYYLYYNRRKRFDELYNRRLVQLSLMFSAVIIFITCGRFDFFTFIYYQY